MTPIPPHLSSLDWYRGHLASLAAQGLTPRHDPGGAAPAPAALSCVDFYGADLSGADLRRADLRGACLQRADLTRADLSGADMRGTNLPNARLTGADLSGARLTGADLLNTDLRGARLTGAEISGTRLTRADLSGADLRRARIVGADLRGARGIRSAGPVGAEGRMIYGVAYPTGPMIKAGCHWDTLAATVAAVEARYADGSGHEHLRADYLAALAWVGGVR